MAGFDTADVLSSEEYYSEFLCPICQLLARPAVITCCSHVYCFGCIEEWTVGPTRSTACPKCKADLGPITITAGSLSPPVRDLKEANPLAYRMLGRVRVQCPLRKQGCRWQGDYDSLEDHLTNSAEHVGTLGGDQTQTAEANALALKDEANREFEARQFLAAIKLYTKAISVCPTLIALWSNRAAARLMLADFAGCIQDCNRSIELDPAFVKAYLRKARAQVKTGEFQHAVATIDRGLAAVTGPPPAYGALPTAADPKTARDLTTLRSEWENIQGVVRHMDMAADALDKREWARAAQCMASVMQESTAPKVQLLNARVELGIGRTDRTLSITLGLLRADSSNVAAYCVRAEALFMCEEFDNATRLLKQALRMDPDNAGAKLAFRRAKNMQQQMARTKQLNSNRDFVALRDVFTELLDGVPATTPLYASLMADRANAHYRLGNHEESLQDCARAIYARDDCKRAWLTKRLALHGLGRHAEAKAEMQKLINGWGANDEAVKHAYFKADFELRRSNRPDYYKLFGVPQVSTEGEIKAAYRRRALELHPDKHAHKGTEEQTQAEASFKLLSEGLEILGDAQKRQLYDEGYDKEKITSRIQAAQRAAHSDNHRGDHHH